MLRLRIIKAVQGEIDGVPLNRFSVGEVYDVGTALGSYLLATAAAVPVVDERPTSVSPPDVAKPLGNGTAATRAKRATAPRIRRRN